MIHALNVWRYYKGAPSVPTISGTRTPSRKCRKQWRMTLRVACVAVAMERQTHETMERRRDLEACPEALFGDSNARELGRFVRMAKAVRAGFEAPIRGAP